VIAADGIVAFIVGLLKEFLPLVHREFQKLTLSLIVARKSRAVWLSFHGPYAQNISGLFIRMDCMHGESRVGTFQHG
jgi:hypothetical protein